MRILQVINSLKMGGAEKLITELVPRLTLKNNLVEVLVFDGSDTPFMQDLKNAGIRVISFNNGTKNPYSLSNLIKLIPLLRKYEIVHSHTTPAQIFTMLSKVLGGASTRIVTTEHSTNNHRRGKWQYKIIDRLMYGCYNHIICVTEESKKKLENQIGEKQKISVIRNGIDVEKFHSSQPLSRQEIGVKESDYLLIMVGRFVDAKDQDTIIQALCLLPDKCKLLLVGTGEREKECKALAKSLNVENRVLFMGTRKDVPQILHTSDVIIMSSHWEGLSLSSVEGMSVNKPFVASDVEGLREVVNGAGLLFKEGDYKQLAKEVLQLINDRKLYEKISLQCLNRARHYEITTMVEEYNNVYLHLLTQ